MTMTTTMTMIKIIIMMDGRWAPPCKSPKSSNIRSKSSRKKSGGANYHDWCHQPEHDPPWSFHHHIVIIIMIMILLDQGHDEHNRGVAKGVWTKLALPRRPRPRQWELLHKGCHNYHQDQILFIQDVQAKVVSEIIRKTLGIRREVSPILSDCCHFKKDSLRCVVYNSDEQIWRNYF